MVALTAVLKAAKLAGLMVDSMVDSMADKSAVQLVALMAVKKVALMAN
jgi:hypothetical protein